MSHICRAWLTFLLIGSLSLASPAQTTSPANNSSPGARVGRPVEERALNLLDQLFAATKGFQDDGLRIRLEAQVGNTLWDYDQPRARQLLSGAFRAIALAKLHTGTDHVVPSAYAAIDAGFPLRNEILKILSERDPTLARELIESVVNGPPGRGPKPATGPNGTSDERANHYMILASDLLGTDPLRAIEAAKLGLTHGAGNINVFSQFARFLQSVSQKDRAAAAGLFTYALSVVQRDPTQFPRSIRFLSTYVFSDYGCVPRFNLGIGAAPSTVMEASPAIVESFLDFVFNVVMQQSVSADSHRGATTWARAEYPAVGLLLPYFDKRMPEKAATLRSKLNEVAGGYPAGRDLEAELASPTGARDHEKKGDSAGTREQKDSLYRLAAILYINNSEYDYAFSVAQKIGEPRLRSSLSGQILAAQARTAL